MLVMRKKHEFITKETNEKQMTLCACIENKDMLLSVKIIVGNVVIISLTHKQRIKEIESINKKR